MKRCRCCRQSWPLECFRIIHGAERRTKCKACEASCVPGSNANRSRAYRGHLRAQVAAVRRARAA